MKNKIFSRGVYVEGLRKLKIFGLISLAIMLLIEISPVLIAFSERGHLDPSCDVEVLNFWSMCPAALVAMLAVTPIMMFTLFSGYNKRSFCDFYHALPYTRVCVYVSFIAAVLTWVIGITVISIAVGIGSLLCVPWAYALSFSGVGTVCLILLGIMLLLCGAIALASSVTGTLLSNITVTGLILFFPRYIGYVVSSLVVDKAPLLANVQYIPLMSPRYNLLIGLIFGGSYFDTADIETYIAIAYTFAVAIAYLLLAAFLFVRRKSEIAGQSAPGRKTQTVVRIAVALVPSVLGTGCVMNRDYALGIILWIISLIAYFAYEILSTMRWRNLLRALPYVAAVAALNGAMVLAVFGMSGICMSYTPSAESVDSVRILTTGRYENYIDNEISHYKIEDKEIIKIVTDALEDNVNAYNSGPGRLQSIYNYQYEVKNIAIKDGIITRYRKIYFSEKEYSRLASLLKNNEKLRENIMKLPDYVTGTVNVSGIDVISAKESEELLELLQTEINEKGFDAWMTSVNSTVRVTDESFSVLPETVIGNNELTLYINYTVDSITPAYIHITVSKNVYPKTFEYILQLSWKKIRSDDNFEEIIETLKLISEGKFSSENAGISYVSIGCDMFVGVVHYAASFGLDSYADYYHDDVKADRLYGDEEYDAAEVAAAMYDILSGEGKNALPDIDGFCFFSVDMQEAEIQGNYIRTTFYAPAPKQISGVFEPVRY